MRQLNELAFFTDNVDGMIAFYEQILEAEPGAKSEGMGIFQMGETKLFIHRNYEPGEGDLPPENHFAYDVDDVDAACHKLEEAGIKIEVEPKDYYWGRSAYLRDPDGNLIELHQTDSTT